MRPRVASLLFRLTGGVRIPETGYSERAGGVGSISSARRRPVRAQGVTKPMGLPGGPGGSPHPAEPPGALLEPGAHQGPQAVQTPWGQPRPHVPTGDTRPSRRCASLQPTPRRRPSPRAAFGHSDGGARGVPTGAVPSGAGAPAVPGLGRSPPPAPPLPRKPGPLGESWKGALLLSRPRACPSPRLPKLHTWLPSPRWGCS